MHENHRRAPSDTMPRPPSLASCSSSRPSSEVSNSATSDESSISSHASSTVPSPGGLNRSPRPFPRFKSPTYPASDRLPTLASLKIPPTRLRESDSTPSATIIVNPRHALMRSRRTSLPANLAHTTSYSVLTGVAGVVYGSSGENRMSVASVSSFDSLPEEGEPPLSPSADIKDPQSTIHAFPRQYGFAASTEGPTRKLSSTSLSPTRPNQSRSPTTQRYSLPTPPAYQGGFQSFALPRSRPPSRPSSPLGRTEFEGGGKELVRKATRDSRDGERAKREERRWRIALELRETERSYVSVLEEIDQFYYQPLLSALPIGDLARRRATSRPTTSQSMPTSPIIRPTSLNPLIHFPLLDNITTPTLPLSTSAGQIISRREIAEIFSNFPTVLDLSRIILTTLDTHVPDRLSDPPPPVNISAVALGRHEPQLSSSVDTDLSISGPSTPSPSPYDFGAQSEPMSRSASNSTKEKRTAGPPLALGKALLPILPFLKSYSIFISNFAASLSRISALETSLASAGPMPLNGNSWDERRRWQLFCEERKKAGAGRGLGLGGLLLSIVQRVPRYRLLLLDLLEFTERDHPDFRELQAAFQLVDQVATHLESQIQAHTNILQILVLQRSFTNLDAPLLVPGRRLLKIGQLRKLDRRGMEQVRTFFLFNDVLIHASGGEPLAGWAAGLGIVGADGEAARASPAGSAPQTNPYRFHRKLKLEEITVVEIQDMTEEGRRFGFEMRSREKSFAVYANTLGEKLEWIQVMRKAINDLMSDRRTLQRAADSEQHHILRRDRRISLPANASAFANRLLSLPTHFSLVTPRLDLVPPTPRLTREKLLVESPDPISAASSATPFDPEFIFPPSDHPTSPSLSRETSEGSIAFPSATQVLTSTLVAADSVIVELRVADNYSAPVWVPDSKVDRCMRCASHFGVLRRRHHCRLCGGVVCWACSTKTFVIPAHDEGELDRLARACDRCYSTTFPSLDLLPTLTTTGILSSTVDPILDPNSPRRDGSTDSTSAEPFALERPAGGEMRKEYASVIAQLTALLSR